MARARLLLVFLVALVCLGALAGKRGLTRSSEANHYSHMALAWLDGRLAHEGNPPGYERRRHDDWGVVYTVEFKPRAGLEGPIRGYPCKRAACLEQRRKQGIETWLTTDGREVSVKRRDVQRRARTWYVTFPPAPALLMLPWVALWGAPIWDGLFTVLLGALTPVVLVYFLDRARGLADGRDREHLWIAAAWTLASPACWVSSHGAVWFTAQTVGALLVTLYLALSWEARRPAAAGLCLALAVASRVTPAFALPVFLVEWWRSGRKPLALVKFAAPLVITAAALMWMNAARFDDPLQFGHRYLEIRWQQRIQELGMFSLQYLPRNLEAALWLRPQVITSGGPWLRWSQHGMGLLVGCPWLWALIWARDRGDAKPKQPSEERPAPSGRLTLAQRVALWVAIVGTATPTLLYQNTGFRQFSYRFAMDYLPMLLLLLAFGGAARGRRRRLVFAVLVVLGALVQLYGAWYWGRAPGRLFVRDMWWPFVDLTAAG